MAVTPEGYVFAIDGADALEGIGIVPIYPNPDHSSLAEKSGEGESEIGRTTSGKSRALETETPGSTYEHMNDMAWLETWYQRNCDDY